MVDFGKTDSTSGLQLLGPDRSRLGFLVSGDGTALMEGQSGTSLSLVGVKISNNSQYGPELFHLTTCIVDFVELDHLLDTALDLQRISE